MLQHLIIEFTLNYVSVGLLHKVKSKTKFKFLALKVVALADKRLYIY